MDRPSLTAGDFLRRFSGRAVDHGGFRPVSALIEEQVDRSPERPAVSYGGRTLTYRRLDELANGLAAELADRGVAGGDVVPTALVNSLELPVAYLALMKLGAAFVPLDPSWPQERILAAFEVLPPGPVLCAADLPAGRRGRLPVDVDRIVATPRRPGVTPRPEDLVYGFFTSGTTGVPKCAMNRHRGLTNRFRFMTRYFGATGEEVVLQNSGHTFDSSLWQLLWPLTLGGRTVLPVQGEFLNLQRTIEVIAAHGITVADFVASVFNALVAIVEGDEKAQRKLASLRHLIVGSEAINPRAVHRLRELLPGLRVTNGYGPTEASIGMVFHPVSASDGDDIPLGRPIDNCYAVVVDDDLQPLAPGVTGEIAIGGSCLGEGYLGDAEATGSAFVANPFPSDIPGDRIYLTGDLGHLDAEGRLFFAGRKDFQVKIGGVRIEPGEIEAAAQRCAGVRQAVVIAAPAQGPGGLALFVVGGPGEAALGEELRGVLPRTSLPGHVFTLPEMPLTGHGKVDRARLRAMLERRLAEDADRLATSAPSMDLRGQVLRAFRLALARPGLAADAHFMEAGGDSLRVVSAVRAIAAETGVRTGVQDLLDHPTADGLAGLLERRQADGSADEPEPVLMARDATVPDGEPIRAADPAGELRTVLLTGVTGFVGSRLAHELLAHTDLSVLCLARAADDEAATARAVNALAERGLWEPRFAHRMAGYAADLGRPGLGLEAGTWERLARTCDLVLHNGALVNFLFDYRAHRPVNVRGTVELLRLAMAHRPVPLHHVSTLATLEAEAARHGGPLPEHHDPSRALAPAGGYGRSKWIAERYLAEARERGAVVTLLRLGEIMPSADNCHPNTVALTHLLFSAFLRIGARPDAAIRSDYTPVDYVAERVVAAVHDREAWGRTLHVFHPRSVRYDEVIDVPRVPAAEFVARLRDAADEDRELATLASLLPDTRAFGRLLTDNPALFGRDECARLEERWGLGDGRLEEAIGAYRVDLLARHAPAFAALERTGRPTAAGSETPS